jgi:hypothetical protein
MPPALLYPVLPSSTNATKPIQLPMTTSSNAHTPHQPNETFSSTSNNDSIVNPLPHKLLFNLIDWAYIIASIVAEAMVIYSPSDHRKKWSN